MTVRIPITLACGDYDRTRAIKDGRVAVEGCDVTYLPMEPEEAFHRAFKHQEFDVCELSFSSYLRTVDAGTSAYVGVPAFVSRLFRHSAVYIRTDRGIRQPPTSRATMAYGVPDHRRRRACADHADIRVNRRTKMRKAHEVRAHRTHTAKPIPDWTGNRSAGQKRFPACGARRARCHGHAREPPASCAARRRCALFPDYARSQGLLQKTGMFR